MATVEHDAHVREQDPSEGRALLDRQARRYLDMSGEEFTHAWEAGEFVDREDSAVVRVAMLLPFGR